MFVRNPTIFESQDATKITSALADSCIYLFTMMIRLYLCMVVVVTMPTTRPIGVCRVNNLYQEPFLEDCYFKEEEQCDSELKGEDDGWLGTENTWCPLLDF